MTENINITETKFKQDLAAFFETVTQENYQHKYDELTALVLSYRGKINNKDRLIALMMEVEDEMKLDGWQDEVYLDIAVRLHGQCSPGRIIKWE